MLPFVEQPVLQIGDWQLETFHALVVAGTFVGYRVAVRRAAGARLARADASSVILQTIAGGFIGSHLFESFFYQPEALRNDPLQLLRIWSGMSSFGGILGGVATGYLAMRRRALPPAARLRLVDAIAFAFPFAWLFGRAGCALAHDHLGISSVHALAVETPSGPRFDLGLLELLATLPIAAAFALLRRRELPAGFFLAAFLALYGPLRFGLDLLRTGDARYFGWTPAQYLSVVAACVGIWLLVVLLAGPARRVGCDV